MRAVFGGNREKIDGQILPTSLDQDELVGKSGAKPVRPVTRINGQRVYFHDLARMAWPDKTESHLAFVARVDARTARRWLAEDSEPPAAVLGVILAEIMRRFHQR